MMVLLRIDARNLLFSCNEKSVTPILLTLGCHGNVGSYLLKLYNYFANVFNYLMKPLLIMYNKAMEFPETFKLRI